MNDEAMPVAINKTGGQAAWLQRATDAESVRATLCQLRPATTGNAGQPPERPRGGAAGHGMTT
jgi:hypothetical protein